MTMLADPEYRRLVTESSNEIIRHDARRGEGEYEQAALHIREAGAGRLRMGRIAYEAGNFARAAADWLSAGACFFLAAQLEPLQASVRDVQKLDQDGRIPADRRDIRAALQEREGQLRTLEEKRTRFIENYRGLAARFPQRNRERLEFLCAQVRELPGFADLHFEIYQHARSLGQPFLAGEHLNWAAKFNPDNPEYVGRFGYQLIQSGQPTRAAELGRKFLLTHPTELTIRIMLAHALLSSAGGHEPNPEEAIKLLNFVIADRSIEPSVRLSALFLNAVIRYDRGSVEEYRRLLDDFDQEAESVSPNQRARVDQLRQLLPAPTTNEGGAERPAIGQHIDNGETKVASPQLGLEVASNTTPRPTLSSRVLTSSLRLQLDTPITGAA